MHTQDITEDARRLRFNTDSDRKPTVKPTTKQIKMTDLNLNKPEMKDSTDSSAEARRHVLDTNLMDLFLRNGFIDVTRLYDPRHVGKPNGKCVWKPIKGSRQTVYLDYHTLKSDYLPHLERTATEDELVAYICFHRLPLVSRNILIKNYNSTERLMKIIWLIRLMREGVGSDGYTDTMLWDNVKEVYEKIKME